MANLRQSTHPQDGDQRPSGPPATGRSIVLVGPMGAGKSSVGRRLAKRLGLPFTDADDAIEAAAGRTIPEIFDTLGEEAFRDGERRVIARLLAGPRQVLATGGGAFMDPLTRAAIRERGVSVWLRADLDVLVERTSRRTDRPLLRGGDPREILERLLAVRNPVYAEADVTVESGADGLDDTVDRLLAALPADALADRENTKDREDKER
ncbi:MAG: shikimate kinase [Hyphomicrobiales bacterium]|nr:shikimate kinase [Hyphomicrobiales bacterium]MCP5370666.1 shikimate kinase [Hyphomicrobiales bacterium]